jgi:hypothetical protein
MSSWPIERRWNCSSPDSPNELKSFLTDELSDQRAMVLLGSAGTGKTFEMNRMIDAARAYGRDVRVGRLASLASNPQGLAGALTGLADEVRENTVIFLDSLDESMVPDRFAALRLAEWIRSSLSATKPALRIACRSAVLPQDVLVALRETYGASNTMSAVLQPLGDRDIRLAAATVGVDVAQFIAEIGRAGAASLSQHPLTLNMLMRVFSASGSLPANRAKLFEQGVRRLAEERDERRSVRTQGDVPVEDILEVANWVACITLLSGREIIDLGDSPQPDTIELAELTSLNTLGLHLTSDKIQALAASGLCEGFGGRRFRFVHRQVAEYLAGRSIGKLLPHQARSLLENGLGWTSGVASPLRETAAFAAHDNQQLAEWIAESDPLVIGQSGVADDSLRRRATLALVRKFRERELTNAQIRVNTTEFIGLKYRGAVPDLEPLLRERAPESEDVLEFAIHLVEVWELSELSDALADLVLDPSAPEDSRVAAGYALSKIGSDSAKWRLKPLIGSGGHDPDMQLHGLALRCNWPANMTVTELLGALSARARRSFTGAYGGFLLQLDSQGFQADGDRAKGLQWATSYLRRSEDYDPAVRIAKRIARAALDDLDDPVILKLLATLMLEATRRFSDSPLGVLRHGRFGGRTADQSEDEPPLKGRIEERRTLLDAIASLAQPEDHIWWATRETPHLLEAEDYLWLLDRATDARFSESARVNYAQLARVLFRVEDPVCVEGWLNVHDQDPIRSVFSIPIVVQLDSKAAQDAKRIWIQERESSLPSLTERVTPPPKERIAELLHRCETDDFRFFHNLCLEMTLEEDSTDYGFARFLIATPGWQNADSSTRARIVAAAKKFLEKDTKSVEEATTSEWSSIARGGMEALWLIDHIDRQPTTRSDHQQMEDPIAGSQPHPSWLESRSDEWWNRWAWFILRELYPNMVDEGEEPKFFAMKTLIKRAPDEVRKCILRLGGDADPKSQNTFTSLLTLLQEIGDSILDRDLVRLIAENQIASDRLRRTIDFVLRDGDSSASEVCMAQLRQLANDATITDQHPAVSLAVGILINSDGKLWNDVLGLLETRPEIRRLALGGYAHSERRRRHTKDDGETADEITIPQMGDLLRQLFLAFPPETDPERDGAYWVGPDDSGRSLRNAILSALGDKGDVEAVKALRRLEEEFGIKYPWLRRPRARAEREYRNSRWNPVPPEAVARILSSRDSRLMRNAQDVLDGIAEAVELYSASLRHASPSALEDLWNTPTNAKPSPKLEERASDKLCAAIREYFTSRAVTAGRELQIRRGIVQRQLGGEAGSEVDVLVAVPAIGTTHGKPIEVPIEVKRSSNRDVKTSLKAQLVDRYMREVNADAGLYVVMWFDAPNLADGFTPKWPDIQSARKELESQAEGESNTEWMVRALVVDCSLA